VFDGVGSTFHPIRSGHGIQVDATANTMERFVGATRETGILQGESGAPSRNARDDDSDVGHGSSPVAAQKSWMDEQQT
jgi:hypothetical protein